MDMTLDIFLYIWSIWCMPFEPFPFGDPYLAAMTLFSLSFYGIWRLAFGGEKVY